MIAEVFGTGRVKNTLAVRRDGEAADPELFFGDSLFLFFIDVEGPDVAPPCFPLPVRSFIDEDRVVALLVFLFFFLVAGLVGYEENRPGVLRPLIRPHARLVFGELDRLSATGPHEEELLFVLDLAAK